MLRSFLHYPLFRLAWILGVGLFSLSFWVNNASAQTAPTTTEGYYCDFSCISGTGEVSVRTDFAGQRCGGTGGVFGRRDPSDAVCAPRCEAFCTALGEACDRMTAPRCAQHQPPAPSGSESAGRSGSTAPPLNVTFPDPLGGGMSVNTLIGRIVRIVVGLAGVFFLAVFIWSGFLYLTAAGNSKQAGQGKQGIVNAIIGLAVIMLSYILVSFVIELANRVQGRNSGVDTSVEESSGAGATTPGRGVRPSGDTRSADASFGSGSTPPTPGSAQDACRRFYGGDRSTCESSGSCPVGVTNFEQLMSLWGRDLPASSPGGPSAAAACRECINRQIEGAQGLYPGLDDTCVPALTNAWRGICAASCSRGGAGAVAAPGGPEVGAGAGTTAPEVGACDPDLYNTHSRDAGSDLCNRCIRYWTNADHLAITASVGCPTPREKAVVWCSTQETRSHHESPGYCNLLRRR